MPVRRRAPAALAVLLAATLAVGAGCGSFAREYPPTGVDGLTIPTPSPDPADFVGVVDNPWLPLAPGTVLTYDVALPGGGGAVRTLTVLDGTVQVAGVAATAVREELVDDAGAPLERATRYYAQDTRGNVWWLGRVVEGGPPDGTGEPGRAWRAGERGALAGLAMAAGPRLGDGYRPAYVPGARDLVARIVEVGEDRIEVELAPPRGDALVVEEHERGVGLTRRTDEASGLVETLTSSVTR